MNFPDRERFMGTHYHEYKFDCNSTNEHKHKLHGFTCYMIGVSFLHFHVYYGMSNYMGHTHYYSGITGMPIKTENGHIHKMSGFLETNESHEHKYNSYTFGNVGYIGTTLINQSNS